HTRFDCDWSSDVCSSDLQALSDHFGVRYTSLWVNLYRDQHDSTAWHGDNIGRIQPESIVPVLTLGATRRFLIRPTHGGPSTTFQIGRASCRERENARGAR